MSESINTHHKPLLTRRSFSEGGYDVCDFDVRPWAFGVFQVSRPDGLALSLGVGDKPSDDLIEIAALCCAIFARAAKRRNFNLTLF